MAEQKTVVLGAEYDSDLRGTVLAVLRESGSLQIDHQWAVGGSQEIEVLDVEIEGDRVMVEAETYVGLSISGRPDVVDRIVSRIRELAST
jgi:hypothetical protein